MENAESAGLVRLNALARRRAKIEQELAGARENVRDMQEEALLLVPQELLSQVNGGTTQDFSRIHEMMDASVARDLKAANASLESLERLLQAHGI
jgi:hypothetical protein